MGEEEVQARSDTDESALLRFVVLAYTAEEEAALTDFVASLNMPWHPVYIRPDIPDDVLGLTVKMSLGLSARRDD
jgi:hypothetical protein